MENKWYVTLYKIDRVYGGAEEGGWWFTAGWVQDHEINASFDHEESAIVYADATQGFVDWLNKGKPSIYSVASDGEYILKIENHEPIDFPELHPYYS